MCDQDHFEEDLKKYSRRDMGILMSAAGAAMMFPRSAFAVDVTENEVEIKTPDGVCDAYFVTPKSGAHAAVIVWPDIFGLRPAFRTMGKRLAESGYSVLVVNQFYRSKKAPVVETDASNASIQDVRPLAQALTPKTHMTDAKAFVEWLDAQPQTDTKRKIGTIGYCMGGPIVLRTAAAVPDRVGAGGSFHGGGLVTANDDSPHRLIPTMKASFLIAIAENDDQRDPESKNVLKASFEQTKLSAEIEVYPAGHGWCPPDTKVYHKEQSERAWNRLLALFEKSLAK